MGLPPLPSGSVDFCELFREKFEIAEKLAACVSRKIEAKVISCERLMGPQGSPSSLCLSPGRNKT
jgi:hypothetical protein